MMRGFFCGLLTALLCGLVCVLWCMSAQATLAPILVVDHALDAANSRLAETIRQALEQSYRQPQTALLQLRSLEAELPAGIDAGLRWQLRLFLCDGEIRWGNEDLGPKIARWLEQSRAGRDAPGEVAALLCQGAQQEAVGDTVTALRTQRQALALAEAGDSGSLRVSARIAVAWLTGNEGRATEAISLLKTAYEEAAAINDSNGKGVALLYLAHLLDGTGQSTQAEAYYQRLLTDAESRGNYAAMPVLLHSLASVAGVRKAHDQAEAYLNKAYEACKTIGDVQGLGHVALSLSGVKREQAKPLEAERWAREAMLHFSRLGAVDQEARAELSLSRALLAQKKVAAAQSAIDHATQVFQTQAQPTNLMFAAKVQADVLEAAGRYAEAFAAMERYLDTRATFATQQQGEAATRLRVQFEGVRVEQDKAALAAAETRQAAALASATQRGRLQSAVLVMGSLLLLAVAVWFWRGWRAARKMKHLAMTDELTDIANRRSIWSHGALQLEQARREGFPCSVIVFDIDWFKRINDGFGHAVGDTVIRRVGQAALPLLRANDRVGRTGGEEFLIVMAYAPVVAAQRVAERLREAVEQLDFADVKAGMTPTISLGVAEWTEADTDFAALVTRADNALYRAKERGRNRVALDPDPARPDPGSPDSA